MSDIILTEYEKTRFAQWLRDHAVDKAEIIAAIEKEGSNRHWRALLKQHKAEKLACDIVVALVESDPGDT